MLVNGKQSAHKFLGTYNDYTSETSLWLLWRRWGVWSGETNTTPGFDRRG
jgi:hypothetical protein